MSWSSIFATPSKDIKLVCEAYWKKRRKKIKMGTCVHCKEQITLIDKEKGCPNCGMNPYYCWNCKGEIFGVENECPVCHYFKCETCGVCGSSCMIGELLAETDKMSKREMIEYIYKKKDGKIRKNCPKGVPISYAHSKLRNMVLRMLEETEDGNKFEKRFEGVLDFQNGYEWTISSVKEEGHYSIEWREASNYCICMGKAKKILVKDKYGNKHEKFVRESGNACKYARLKELRKKYCKGCKNTFDFEMEVCPECVYKIGKRKGEAKELVIRMSETQFCSMPRNQFIIKEDVMDGKTD